MTNIRPKPKLVFFQHRYDDTLPEFLLLHRLDHVKCLAEFFDVVVINKDCDYQRICDVYTPDLTLFESGLDNLTCTKPRITNTGTCLHIPKLGLHNADSFSGARAGFLSDMYHWGIDTFFTISTTAAEYTPEIAQHLFVWPNFVDPDIYRDYGEWKSIPVLLTGNTQSFYPWRQKIFKLVSERFPSLSSPHPGYDPGRAVVQFLSGESYARTINASSIVPACGTVAKEVVRKHFEIPACRACLVAEQSPGLEAAGFLDMQNCVFADEHDVLDKLAYLFRNADELEGITNAGYRLVRSRHLLQQRSQIRQWFDLHRNLRQGQKIIQVNPFEPLTVVSTSEAHRHSSIISNGLHLTLLHQGNENLQAGRYLEAEKLYLKCLNYMRWMPEARLGLALCNLNKGKAKVALSWIEPSISYILGQYRAIDPDPVEWAYFIICFLCLGKREEALSHAGQFPWLRHPELDRTRWVTNVLNKRTPATSLAQESIVVQRLSVHPLPAKGVTMWMKQICVMLRACGQFAAAAALEESLSSRPTPPRMPHPSSPAQADVTSGSESVSSARHPRNAPSVSSRVSVGSFRRRLLWRKVQLAFRRLAARVLHPVETRCGFFLPYRLSAMKNDEFFKVVQSLAREEKLRTALIVGATLGEGTTEAFFAGALENQNKPTVFCIAGSRRRFLSSRLPPDVAAFSKWYRLTSGVSETVNADFQNALTTITQREHITRFDAVVIDGYGFSQLSGVDCSLGVYADGAKLIMLHNINDLSSFDNYQRLLGDPEYSVLAANPGLRKGYAIFRRCFEDNVVGGDMEIGAATQKDNAGISGIVGMSRGTCEARNAGSC
jgi:tetratricopeptide (TPR) repeat protein